MDATIDSTMLTASNPLKGLFTRQNAADNARKAVAAREQRKRERAEAAEAKRLEALKPPVNADEISRKQAIQKQIERLDDEILSCADSALLVRLVAAKATLYALIYPKPGSLRHRQSRSRSSEPADPQEL